jgi:hypothetical protein
MELVHESIIERSEIFQTLRAGFLETLEKVYLGARVDLLKETAELSHCIAASRDAQHIVNETLDKLLSHVFATQVPVGEFA